MTNTGLERFARLLTLALVGRHLRYKRDGLMYEVVEVHVDGTVRVRPAPNVRSAYGASFVAEPNDLEERSEPERPESLSDLMLEGFR